MVVRVACDVCKKKRGYRLAHLVETFGAQIAMPQLLDRLTVHCAWRRDLARKAPIRKQPLSDEPCGARFVDLERPRPPPDETPAEPASIPSIDPQKIMLPREIARIKRALRG